MLLFGTLHKTRAEVFVFYTNFVKLCNQKGVSPSAAAEEMGFQRSVVTRWSKGVAPRAATVAKVADYFEVAPEELLVDKKENAPGSDAESEIEKALAQATPAQRELISSILDMNENQLLFVKELVDKVKKLVK